MKEGYISKNSLLKSIGEISKLCLISLGLESGFLAGILIKTRFFQATYYISQTAEIILIISCFATGLLFSIMIYLYISANTTRRFKTPFVIGIISWIVIILFPAFLVVNRFYLDEYWIFFRDELLNWSLTLLFIYVIYGFIKGHTEILSEIKNIVITPRDIIYIVIHFWQGRRNMEVETRYFIEPVENDIYVKEADLSAFQSTLSTVYFDSLKLAEHLSSVNLKDQYSILDIGGYEGLFTSNMISRLEMNAITCKKVVNVDPIDAESKYRESLERNTSGDVNFHHAMGGFEHYSPDHMEQFDIVLASHSLYSIIDNNKMTIDAVLNRMKLFCAPNGFIVVILISKEGRSYRYKRECYSKVFGKDALDDLTSATIKDALTRSGIRYWSYVVNNFFNFTKIVRTEDINVAFKNETLNSWISYFMRLTKIGKTEKLHLYKQLFYNIQKLHETIGFDSDEVLKRFQLDINESRILTHKSEIVIFRPST
jgi:hypothetical protein